VSGVSVGERFERPSALERVFNRLVGALVGLGLALAHNYLLEARAHRSGRRYAVPVNVLTLG